MEYIKICGLKNIEDVNLCRKHGASAVGFIYNVPESPRNLKKADIEGILKDVSRDLITVTVFKPQNLDDIKKVAEEIKTNYYQVHCSFELNQLEGLSEPIRNKLIVALNVNQSSKESMIGFINNSFDKFFAFLIDSSEGYGKLLNYDLIKEILNNCNEAKIIVAGGINEENIESLLFIDNLFGIDVSSSLESEKGVKNPKLIKSFLNKVNKIIKNM